MGRPQGELESDTFRIAAWSRYQIRDQLYVGTTETFDPLGETAEIWQAFLDVEYGLSEAWSLSATFSWLDIDRELPAADIRTRRSGLADTLVTAHWTALDTARNKTAEGGEDAAEWLRADPHVRLRLDFGASLPTGRAEAPVLSMGGTPISLLQTGTGTIDPVVGASLRVDWGGIAAVLGAHATLPFYENRYDFQAGANVTITPAVEVKPIRELTVRLGLDIEHAWRDILNDARVTPGGGWRLALHPAIIWQPDDAIRVFVGAQVPFHRDPVNRTLDSDVTWEVGVSITF